MPNAAPQARSAHPHRERPRRLHEWGPRGTGHSLPGSHALLLYTPSPATSLTASPESGQTGPNVPPAPARALRQLAERLTRRERDGPQRKSHSLLLRSFLWENSQVETQCLASPLGTGSTQPENAGNWKERATSSDRRPWGLEGNEGSTFTPRQEPLTAVGSVPCPRPHGSR